MSKRWITAALLGALLAGGIGSSLAQEGPGEAEPEAPAGQDEEGKKEEPAAPAKPAPKKVPAKPAKPTPPPTSTVPTKRPPDPEVGQRLYQQSCWQCHGTAGLGDGPAASALVGGVPSLKGKVVKKDFDALVEVIQEGRGRMPGYRDDIDANDSRRILVYLDEVMSGRLKPGEAGKGEKDKEKDDKKEEAEPN